MKASELRIGNLIYVDSKLRYVFGTIYKTIQHNCHLQNSTYSENYENECEPIPISKNWLLRFGFKIFNNNDFACTLKYKNFEYCFPKHNLSNGNFATYKKFSTNLKYIHELQNLYFALTGEELTIK